MREKFERKVKVNSLTKKRQVLNTAEKTKKIVRKKALKREFTFFDHVILFSSPTLVTNILTLLRIPRPLARVLMF